MTKEEIDLDAYIIFEKKRLDQFKAHYLKERAINNLEDLPLTRTWGDWDDRCAIFFG